MSIIAGVEVGEVAQGSWTLLILFFAISIIVSFACSVFEAVLLSLTQPYIATKKRDQPEVGARLEKLKNEVDAPLTSILTLNTIAHTIGAIGVGNQVAGLTQKSEWAEWYAVGTAILMTLAVLILSEIIPKTFGARKWRTLAPTVGRMLEKLTWAMTPFVWVIQKFSGGGHHVAEFSRDELKVMAELGRSQGELGENESRILQNLLHLRDNRIHDVMTPRVVVFALQQDLTVKQFVSEYADTPFSRIPIYSNNRDEIGGFVLKDDILLSAARDEHDTKLLDLVRDVPSMPASRSLVKAFEELVADRNHIAVVHDEFGGLAGIVTMEDVVETLLGLEIVDEADTKEDMQEFARRLWKRRAEKMGLDLSEAEEEPGRGNRQSEATGESSPLNP